MTGSTSKLETNNIYITNGTCTETPLQFTENPIHPAAGRISGYRPNRWPTAASSGQRQAKKFEGSGRQHTDNGVTVQVTADMDPQAQICLLQQAWDGAEIFPESQWAQVDQISQPIQAQHVAAKGKQITSGSTRSVLGHPGWPHQTCRWKCRPDPRKSLGLNQYNVKTSAMFTTQHHRSDLTSLAST